MKSQAVALPPSQSTFLATELSAALSDSDLGVTVLVLSAMSTLIRNRNSFASQDVPVDVYTRILELSVSPHLHLNSVQALTNLFRAILELSPTSAADGNASEVPNRGNKLFYDLCSRYFSSSHQKLIVRNVARLAATIYLHATTLASENGATMFENVLISLTQGIYKKSKEFALFTLGEIGQHRCILSAEGVDRLVIAGSLLAAGEPEDTKVAAAFALGISSAHPIKFSYHIFPLFLLFQLLYVINT